MYVSITYLKVKDLLSYPLFFWHVYQINRQIQSAEGFIQFKSTTQGLWKNYTISSWKSKEDMLLFRNNGAHKRAMKALKRVSSEAYFAHIQTTSFPEWSRAFDLLEKAKGFNTNNI